MAYLAIYVDGKVASRFRLEAPVLVGRSRDCDVVVLDPTVSRAHCIIGPRFGSWVITDLGSKNGTAVRDVRVSALGLVDGDEIRLGSAQVRFYEGNPIPRRPCDPQQAIDPHRHFVDQNTETLPLEPGKRLPPRPIPRLVEAMSGTAR